MSALEEDDLAFHNHDLINLTILAREKRDLEIKTIFTKIVTNFKYLLLKGTELVSQLSYNLYNLY